MTSQPPPPDSPDAEVLLGQALRAQVGGPRRARGDDVAADFSETRRLSRFTTAQVLLIAAIIGVVLGMGAAFVVVLA